MRTTVARLDDAKRQQLKGWASIMATTPSGTPQYREASNGIYKAFHQNLIHYFMLRMGTSQEVRSFEDLALETLEKAFKNIGQYRPGSTELSTWVYNIALNCLRDSKRRAKGVDVISVDSINSFDGNSYGGDDRDTFELPSLSITPDVEVARDQRNDLIRAAIGTLSNEKERMAIGLFFFKERTYEEIAEEMQIPMGTVKVAIFRGKRHLKKRLRSLAIA